jgi:hypothetical protein
VVADVALAGLSLGAATTLGATVGGALSGGWRPLWRKLETACRACRADGRRRRAAAAGRTSERPGCPGPARPRRSSACGWMHRPPPRTTPTKPCARWSVPCCGARASGLGAGRQGRALDDGERAELQDEVARRLLPRLLEPTDAWMTRRRQPLPCAQNREVAS